MNEIEKKRKMDKQDQSSEAELKSMRIADKKEIEENEKMDKQDQSSEAELKSMRIADKKEIEENEKKLLKWIHTYIFGNG
jgi:hypothetical protein